MISRISSLSQQIHEPNLIISVSVFVFQLSQCYYTPRDCSLTYTYEVPPLSLIL